MHDIDRGQRAALRAKLLLGVASATAAVASTAAYADQPTAPPATPDKWVPYVDIGGGVGTGMTAGKSDAFVPIWQNIDSMLFASLGIGTETKDNQFENFGAGYRTKINPEWILGGYVGFDSTQLQDSNTFNQTSLGVEAMSADWDARLNAYIAGNETKAASGRSASEQLYINGTTIAILDSAEAAYSGFDGEVGYRVFSTDDTDVRVFIGGFHFSRGNSDSSAMGQGFNFGYRDITGPKARAEATVYDLDILGNQSRFTVGGEIAHDDVRGTTGFIGATLRIPLGDIGGGAQALDELDRRMTDPERRNDTVLTRAQYTKPEPVIIYGPHVTSQPTNTLLYVDNTLGVGTYANPTTFADAASRPTTNAFIVLTSKQLPIVGGATLQPGQTVVAGGQTFTVEGEFSHAKFTHLFDPSSNVTVVPATPGGNVITIASNTSLYGFTIEGDFGNAIYGKNVDHVNISGIAIDGTGGGRTGINLQHTVSGEENITIQNVAISNLTEDGIDLISNISDGGTSTETFKLSNITVSNVGNYGINITDYASNGSKITNSTSLTNVAVTNAQYTAIGVYTTAYGAGSSINQALTISNATVTNTTGYGGIGLTAYAINGGHIASTVSLTGVAVTGSGIFVGANGYGAGSTVAQTLTISNAAITSPVYEGITLDSFVAQGATVTTNDTVSNVTIAGPGEQGIEIVGLAGGAGSQLSQTVNISNATITNVGFAGIYIREEAFYGATANQSVSITGATISNVGSITGFGVSDSAEAYGAGAVATQTVDISNTSVTAASGTFGGAGMIFNGYAANGGALAQYLTLSNVGVTNSGDGIDFTASAIDNGDGVTTAYQKISIAGATISNNSGVGIFLDAYANSGSAGGYQSQAAVGQKVSITNATLSHDYEGIDIRATVGNGASVSQSLSAYGIDIDHSTYDGVRVVGDAETVGFLTQSVTFNNAAGSYNEISYNGSNGVYVTTGASTGGQINQHLYFYSTNIDHNAADGVFVQNRVTSYYAAPASGVYHYSHLQQNLNFEYGSVSHNGGDGISISNTVTYGAQIDQFIELYDEKVNHNAGDGFREESFVTTYGGFGFSLPTNLHSDVYIYNSDFSHNSQNGIEITSSLMSPAYPAITIGYSYVEQHITIGNTTADNNTQNGLVLQASDRGVYGDNIQYITITGSTFDHNGVDGAAFTATQYYGPGSFGDAIQDVTISGSSFNNNARDGLNAAADASGQQGRAEQHFTISNSYFDNNGRNGATFEAYAYNGVYLTGFGCGQVQGLGGGCAFVRQTVSITGSDFSHNTADGIYAYAHANNYGAVYNDSGRPVYTPTLLIENSTVNYNGVNGLHVRTNASNDSYVYSYAIAIDSHFNHNTANGVLVESGAYTGSAIVQKTVLYSDGARSSTVDHNGLYGVYIDSVVRGGAINQTVGIYNTDVSYNGESGVWVRAFAFNPTGGTTPGYVADPTVSAISQYARVDGSTVLGNAGDGVEVTSVATGASATYQYLGVVGSTISGNMNDGVHAFEAAYSGASVNQSLYFAGDTITNNLGDGVYAVEIAVNQSSATQTVNFGYKTGATTYITGNQGDGIYIGAAAFSGATAQQTAFVYDVNSSYNHGNGLSVGLSANGYGFGLSYIYYSHVSQNLIAAYDTFDHNGANGVAVSNVLYYGGAANQTLELISIDASHNAGSGFNETTAMTTIRGSSFSFTTNITTDLYLIDSTFNQNTGGDGISIAARLNGPTYAPAFFGGYSYLEQTTTITGVTADGNAANGLLVDARQSGRYGLDDQTVTISGSEFNHNTGSGAKFLSTSYYGPGGFGDAYEKVTIGTSNFSYNGGNGLQFSAYASGRQGRAEQHVTITGSYIEYNAGDGVHIYASAKNGTYIAGHPCTTVQGLPGGCAFVRQNVYIGTTNISYNTGNGVFVGTYANNYGAIYGVSGRPHSPTLELNGDTITYNGERGLSVSNHVTGNSYAYQYIAMIDTHLDHNGTDGVYASSYVGGASTMLQRVLLYSYHTGASASYNVSGNGFKASIEALGGSYARDVNIVEGVNLSHNGSFGFDGAVAYADGTSTGLQTNAVYFNTINYNGDGVGLYSIGAGAQQVSYIGGNEIGHNAFVGAYGEANFGAFQYVGIYTFGNNVHDNGTNYLFNSFGGSTQVKN
jgi:hypothetical protein